MKKENIEKIIDVLWVVIVIALVIALLLELSYSQYKH